MSRFFIFFAGVVCLSLCNNTTIASRLITAGLDRPVYLTAPAGTEDELYVLEQKGKVRLIKSERLLKTPFLDITDRVHNPLFPGDERGLLGMAFHPLFYETGYFYLNYVSVDQHTIVSRFCVKPLSSLRQSEVVLFNIVQPYSNHNGGQIEFGPDGYLYVGVGDGGSAGDPEKNGQNKNSLLGTILRIDVDSGSPYGIPKNNPFYKTKNTKGEIWLYGLRNPWRFSFDAEAGEIYIGDVGQNSWEEIHVVSLMDGGLNLGWNIMEGSHCFFPEHGCDTAGLVLPVFEYPNDANYMKTLAGFSQTRWGVQGCSITGGYVYRGKLIPEFKGHYLFADYCTGKFWSFVYRNPETTLFTDRTEELRKETGKKQFYVSSFGKGGLGEIYFLDYEGSVYKIISSSKN